MIIKGKQEIIVNVEVNPKEALKAVKKELFPNMFLLHREICKYIPDDIYPDKENSVGVYSKDSKEMEIYLMLEKLISYVEGRQ